MNRLWKEFSKGLISSNPLFVIALGNCPALMMSIKLDMALGMTVGVIFVLLGSNIIISLLRKFVPNVVRIPVFIVVIATFVTIVDLTFHGYVPAIYAALGIYLPLITVNCIIIARAEVFASRNPVLPSIADALGMGLGFGLALIVIAIPRQLLGTGSLSVSGFNLLTLPVLDKHPISVLVLAPGAFLVIGLIHGLLRRIGVEKSE